MKATILTITAILFIGAHGYSNDKPIENAPSEKAVKAKTFQKPVEVKNIWKDMPTFDKYGNEITARARFNMFQNSILAKNENSKSNNNNLTQEIK